MKYQGMSMDTFKGIFPALLTPFKKNGQINKQVLRELVEWNIGKGVNGFYVCGSTAESFMLSSEERKSILETVCDQAHGRVPIIAHIGHISTEVAIDLAQHAKQYGVDAISSVPPFYYNFSIDEIQRHYFEIVDTVACPMVVYNFPAFSNVSFSESELSTFFDDERFIALKNTSSDFFLLERLSKKYPNKIFFNGYDEMFLSGLAAGATGAIGSTFNFMAEKFIRIQQLLDANKFDEAQAEQGSANNIISVLCKVGVMSGAKAILRFMGFDFGEAKKPFHELSEDDVVLLKSACESIL